MKRVIILGSGTIGASVVDAIPGMELRGLISDEVPVGETQGKFKKVPVIGKSEDVNKLLENKDTYLLITVRRMKKEREMWEKLINLDVPREKFINVIHPSAVIPWDYCSVGKGILMAPNVQLSPETTISDNCILYANSLIGHDSTLERYVCVANHASIGARVRVGRGSHIGSNSTIIQGVSIGEFCLVGIGSVVLNDVPPNTVVAGVPARIVGSN